jgi:UDP-N-acetyl-D-mannosaminuronate dehydrogenase
MHLCDDPLCLYSRDRLVAHTPRRILAVAIKAEVNSTSRFVDGIDYSISSAQSLSAWLYEKACVGRWWFCGG